MTATGYLVVALAVLGIGYGLYRYEPPPLIFSPTQMMGALWMRYKTAYLEQGTMRTVDRQGDNVTTSEGQSYTMLRAVWMGDKETFDGSWRWTRDNLQHTSGDKLFAWLFGRRADGSWGILSEQGGNTTASDADQDIALALIFAHARWQDDEYLVAAKEIIRDLWDKEVVESSGEPFLAANNLEKFSESTTALVNVSYLAPYAYRIFAQVDPAHPWGRLVDSSYRMLGDSMAQPLDQSGSASLPPDWIRVNKTSGVISPPGGVLTTNFGYDALRTPWRIALDWQWYREPRAEHLLAQMQPLAAAWQQKGALAVTYAHDGSVIDPKEAPAMYGGTIGYFMVADTAHAKRVYEQKIAALYNPGLNAWKEPLSYYDDNWAWFGIGLYHGLLPNLAASVAPEDTLVYSFFIPARVR